MPPAPVIGHTEDYYSKYFLQNYGLAAMQAYQRLVKANPQVTPGQAAQAFAYNIIANGLKKALTAGITGVGIATAQATGGAAGGLTGPNLGLGLDSRPDGGQGSQSQSEWGHLFIRFAEFTIGAVLIIVGLNAMLRRTQAYQNTKQAVVGVVGMTPPARAVRTEIGARKYVRQTAEKSAIQRRASVIRNDRLSRQQ